MNFYDLNCICIIIYTLVLCYYTLLTWNSNKVSFNNNVKINIPTRHTHSDPNNPNRRFFGEY